MNYVKLAFRGVVFVLVSILSIALSPAICAVESMVKREPYWPLLRGSVKRVVGMLRITYGLVLFAFAVRGFARGRK